MQNNITNITNMCISFCPVVIKFNSSRNKPLPLNLCNQSYSVHFVTAIILKYIIIQLSGMT